MNFPFWEGEGFVFLLSKLISFSCSLSIGYSSCCTLSSVPTTNWTGICQDHHKLISGKYNGNFSFFILLVSVARGNVAYIHFFLNHFPLGFVMLLFLLFLPSLFPFQLLFLWLTLKYQHSSQFFPRSLFLFTLYIFHFYSFNAINMPMIPTPLSLPQILFTPHLKPTCPRWIHSWLLSEPDHHQMLPVLVHHQSASDVATLSSHSRSNQSLSPIASTLEFDSHSYSQV